MKLKNYQEDIVLHVIDIVLEDREDLPRDEPFKTDLAAFTLNRIPPRYIMGERGFTRFVPNFLLKDAPDESTVELFKILAIVNEGADMIISRREAGEERDMSIDLEHAHLVELSYWHNFPQIIGKVLDAETREPVVHAQVSVLLNGELAEPAAAGWSNPGTTIEATKGFYGFWPKARLSREQSLVSQIELVVEHPAYKTHRQTSELTTKGEFEQVIEISTSHFLEFEPALLVKA